MPNQTKKESRIGIPDGAKVEYANESTGGLFEDVGVISGGVTFTYNFTLDEFATGNKGELAPRITQQQGALAFTAMDLLPKIYAQMSGDLIKSTEIPGTAISDAPDQVIPSGWSADQAIELVPTTADEIRVILSASPDVTVSGATAGTLADGEDYKIITDGSVYSGYSIVLLPDGPAGVTTGEVVTINYTSITPVESVTVTAGTSSTTPKATRFRISHEDSNGNIRSILIHRAYMDPGTLNFGFLGQDETGRNTFPLAFTARTDSDQPDGQQLFSQTVDVGVGTPH